MADAAAPHLEQMVYWSRATHPVSEDELMALLTVSRHNNRGAGITGLLIYHRDQFAQCLEGLGPPVEATFARIVPDPRHHDVRLVLHAAVERRAFASWDMACTEVCEHVWLRLSTTLWEDDMLRVRDATAGYALMERIWKAAQADDGTDPNRAEFQVSFEGRQFPLVSVAR